MDPSDIGQKVIKGEKSGKNSEDAGETSVSKPVSNRHVGRPSKSRSFSNQKADEFFKTLEKLSFVFSISDKI